MSSFSIFQILLSIGITISAAVELYVAYLYEYNEVQSYIVMVSLLFGLNSVIITWYDTFMLSTNINPKYFIGWISFMTSCLFVSSIVGLFITEYPDTLVWYICLLEFIILLVLIVMKCWYKLKVYDNMRVRDMYDQYDI